MFFLFFLSANEAGETPLDIARRLKHLQCEELVSLRSLDLAHDCKHITSWNNVSHLCLFMCGFVCVCIVEPSTGREI